MRDVFTEIWESVRRNKLRTTLTGFAVSWGIFMLIVLLGAGNGLMNSFMMGGSGFSTNSVSVGGGWTSKPYDGYRQGRRIKLDDGDIAATASEAFADHVEAVTATVGTSATVSLGKKSFSGYIDGQYPAIKEMSKIEIRAGRFLNDKDIAEKRKVVVLPENTAENLLENGQSAASLIGRNVKIGSLAFTVVGISKSDRMRNDNLLYAPFTTVKTVYGKGQEIGGITFSTKNLRTEADNEDFERRYKAVINQRHHAAPDDERAVWVWNRAHQDVQMQKGRGILSTALWIIGLFTLLGGIVGVSNIMLITVKERTHEFGIRKAIGASPWSITKLIIAESVSITAFFGYLGMFLGMLACTILDKTLGQATMAVGDEQIAMLVNPTVGLDTALEATLVLIVAGTIAGLFPARRAAQVRPIEALRSE
ncbi:MAG: ABC transporter permease [Bacteroidales bacterium]|nr:ABC transporter permease [Bacteroidales bacterium]MBR0084320.1 ABC transporter permease [Bacteroidales bacterium]